MEGQELLAQPSGHTVAQNAALKTGPFSGPVFKPAFEQHFAHFCRDLVPNPSRGAHLLAVDSAQREPSSSRQEIAQSKPG